MTNQQKLEQRKNLLQRLKWIREQVIDGNYATALSAFSLIQNDIESLMDEKYKIT